MKKRSLLLLLILAAIWGCSSNSSSVNEDADLSLEQVSDNDAESLVADAEAPPTPSAPSSAEENIIPTAELTTKVASTDDVIEKDGEYSIYAYQEGDTLMWVAFKLYGDYQRWKDLQKWNQELIQAGMTPGAKLKYIPAESDFQWVPKGNPYLIQRGDYLGKISFKVYKSAKFWRSIWRNNAKMIKSPDLIFAGFTLYYLDKKDITKNQ